MKSNGYSYYAVLKDSNELYTCMSWCFKNYNRGSYVYAESKFWFKKQEDLVLFKLTWDCLH